jgi:hypothetical protein
VTSDLVGGRVVFALADGLTPPPIQADFQSTLLGSGRSPV